MENRDVKMVSMGMMIATLVLQKSCIDSMHLNTFVKEIVVKHRDKAINSTYGNLAKVFSDTLKLGPNGFTCIINSETSVVNQVNSITALCNKCPLLAYALITQVKMIARFDACKSCNDRVYNAYIAALQSLDGLHI